MEIEQLIKDGEFELDNVTIKGIKIFKSARWTNDFRIMFISFLDTCRMNIYDESNHKIVGFDFINDFDRIINIFQFAKKYQ